MATIRLYAGMINQMPGLIKDVKLSVASYKTELAALQKKSLSIRKDICNMDDVISSLQTSTQTQEAKLDSLETLSKNVEQFTDNVVRIDNEVADLIKQRKDEFFGKYTHLKPDCEKDLADKWKDFCSSASEWCKEHWATVVTVVAVILVAVLAVVTFGAAIAVVAAIAGIISLTLCVADGICMAVTGGKNLSAVFRENGWNVLADIFQGLQIGCDIVSIVFPAGLAFKAMARIGVKTFARTLFNTTKETARKTMVDVFQSGFGKGIINLNKTAFKAFIFDIDDLARVGSRSKSTLLHNAGEDYVNPDGSINWPPNNGFNETPKKITLKPGTKIDRYGNDKGTFVSPEGTPYETRSLAPGTESKPYNSYEVVKPIDVMGGKTASWFDQPGGGMQYKLPNSIRDLMNNGFIK